MATIDQLIRNTQAIDMQELVADSLDYTRSELIAYQRYQMLQGYKADGTRIGKYKNKYYAAKKYAQNPLAGIGNNSVVFGSTDTKTNDLQERFGNDIFGLRDVVASEYAIMYLQPEGIKRITQKIFK
jgi:hypothetical protein